MSVLEQYNVYNVYTHTDYEYTDICVYTLRCILYSVYTMVYTLYS